MAVETRAPQLGSIPAVLEELQHRGTGEGWMLSVYVDTSSTRTLKQAYLLAFRDLAAKLRQSLKTSESATDEGFETAVQSIERYLAAPFVTPHHGVAIFADGRGHFHAAAMPSRVEDEVHWSPEPMIAQLRQALDDCERVAVLLFDKESTRFFTIFLDEIVERAHFTDDVPGKQATGDWYGLSQKRYARQHEGAVMRHAKRTIEMMLTELEVHPFDRLFIAGPDEAISTLRHKLPRRLETRVAGMLGIELFASEAEVLRAATVAAKEAERRQELADVESVLDKSTSYAVVGFESTLAALHEGRVDRLMIVDALPGSVRRCTECGRLTALEPCPVCTGMTFAEDDAPSSVIRAAIEQGAKVDVVSGAASERLMQVGGLAAWRRHSDR